MLKIWPVTLILLSCASTTKRKDLGHQDILELAKASYLRGCVEGRNNLLNKKTKGRTFKFCEKKSLKHLQEITDILYLSVK